MKGSGQDTKTPPVPDIGLSCFDRVTIAASTPVCTLAFLACFVQSPIWFKMLRIQRSESVAAPLSAMRTQKNFSTTPCPL
jgi:hypothetical protein